MAFTQGAPLPSVTQTTTRADVTPDYYTQYLQSLSGAGQQAIGRTPAQGIAGYDPLQTMGYGQVPTAATAYQPGLTAAEQTAQTAAAGLDPNRIAALMDPYQRNVVDEMARLQQQNIQRSVLPSLKGAFVGRGDLGSQRYAGATGQTLADMQRALTGQQYGALSAGYKDAVKAAMDELQLQNEAAKTEANIAKMEQELGLMGAGALTKAGAERQAYEQSKLDYPLKQATAASTLMKGYQVPTTQTETFVGPKSGLYQTSDLSNILGVLSLLGGMKTGTAGYNTLATLANKFGFGGTGTSGTTGSTGTSGVDQYGGFPDAVSEQLYNQYMEELANNPYLSDTLSEEDINAAFQKEGGLAGLSRG